MNTIDSIYTTVSNGRVHIAADIRYIGSVDSYNNCFTQFFAWLFGYSMVVNFEGKMRSVNKDSYTQLLRNLTPNDQINDIRERSIFRDVAVSATLPVNNLKMRDVIAREDRQGLFQKLAIAISRGETAKAVLMIGKGAELDATFYDRGELAPSFTSDTEGLYPSSKYDFTVFRAAPILQAAKKGNTVVCDFLRGAGANLSAVTGQEYTFKREITSVEQRREIVVEPTAVPHHHHIKEANGRERHIVTNNVEYRPQVRERTIVNTQDSRSVEKNYRLEQEIAPYKVVSA